MSERVRLFYRSTTADSSDSTNFVQLGVVEVLLSYG